MIYYYYDVNYMFIRSRFQYSHRSQANRPDSVSARARQSSPPIVISHTPKSPSLRSILPIQQRLHRRYFLPVHFECIDQSTSMNNNKMRCPRPPWPSLAQTNSAHFGWATGYRTLCIDATRWVTFNIISDFPLTYVKLHLRVCIYNTNYD